jgi:hypothetical protein
VFLFGGCNPNHVARGLIVILSAALMWSRRYPRHQRRSLFCPVTRKVQNRRSSPVQFLDSPEGVSQPPKVSRLRNCSPSTRLRCYVRLLGDLRDRGIQRPLAKIRLHWERSLEQCFLLHLLPTPARALFEAAPTKCAWFRVKAPILVARLRTYFLSLVERGDLKRVYLPTDSR